LGDQSAAVSTNIVEIEKSREPRQLPLAS
jgi:hypothetical protein